MLYIWNECNIVSIYIYISIKNNEIRKKKRILQARILEWVARFHLQGIFPTQGSNPGLPHCRWVLYQLIATREAREYWSGQPITSLGDLPNPGIKPGSPALQADSLLTELWGLLSTYYVPSAILGTGNMVVTKT